MNKYTLYCTEAQTRKALKLGAPINIVTKYVGGFILGLSHIEKHYINPTAEQMIGWLEEQDIHIDVCYDMPRNYYYTFEYNDVISCFYPSRKEATLATIDAALEYLIHNKNDK